MNERTVSGTGVLHKQQTINEMLESIFPEPLIFGDIRILTLTCLSDDKIFFIGRGPNSSGVINLGNKGDEAK
jgi:hypothetical protein